MLHAWGYDMHARYPVTGLVPARPPNPEVSLSYTWDPSRPCGLEVRLLPPSRYRFSRAVSQDALPER